MKRDLSLIVVAFTVWTYGSEAMDALIGRTEWDRFSSELRCETRGSSVWCMVDGEWRTIDNRPLPVPWELE